MVQMLCEVFGKHNCTMAKSTLLLGHVYWEHLYDLISHHSKVLLEFVCLIFRAGHHETLAHRVQVGSWVE
jgi:hypothetical protein